MYQFTLNVQECNSAMYNRFQTDQSVSYTCQSCINSTLPFADPEDFNENFDIPDDNNFQIPQNYQAINRSNGGLTIAHLNVNGLRSKIDFLKIFLHEEKLDILCLNETKIDSTISNSWV